MPNFITANSLEETLWLQVSLRKRGKRGIGDVLRRYNGLAYRISGPAFCRRYTWR